MPKRRSGTCWLLRNDAKSTQPAQSNLEFCLPLCDRVRSLESVLHRPAIALRSPHLPRVDCHNCALSRVHSVRVESAEALCALERDCVAAAAEEAPVTLTIVSHRAAQIRTAVPRPFERECARLLLHVRSLARCSPSPSQLVTLPPSIATAMDESSWLAWFSSEACVPVLYSLWLRCLGLVLAWACGMLVPQIGALAGSRGIHPSQERLRAIRRDFPGAWWGGQRVMRFPSILHAFVDAPPPQFDRLLQAGLVVGTLAGLCVAGNIVVDSRLALLVAWAIYLSYANMVQIMIYPSVTSAKQAAAGVARRKHSAHELPLCA